MVTEFARLGRGSNATTLVMTAYHVGAVLTAALAIVVVRRFGWQEMFVPGSLPALVLVPLMLVFLPESPSFLASKGRTADYDLGNSLGFLLVLNVGAIAGLAVAGRVADRITPRVAGSIWFLGSAVLLAALAIKLPVLGIYVMVFVTGCFVFSSQVLVYAFTAANHPPRVRATALGMSAGVGRLGAISGPIIGGSLLTAGLAYPWGFFAFAAVGALGGLALTGTRTRQDLWDRSR